MSGNTTASTQHDSLRKCLEFVHFAPQQLDRRRFDTSHGYSVCVFVFPLCSQQITDIAVFVICYHFSLFEKLPIHNFYLSVGNMNVTEKQRWAFIGHWHCTHLSGMFTAQWLKICQLHRLIITDFFSAMQLQLLRPPALRPSQLTWSVSQPKIGSYHPHPPSPLLLLLIP